MIVVKEGLAAERAAALPSNARRTVRRAARSARRAEFRRARQWCARRDRRRASAARRAARRPAARRAGRGRTRAARNAARADEADDARARHQRADRERDRDEHAPLQSLHGTPRCSASVSPSCNAFSASRSRASSMQPIATHGATAASADHCAPPRLPRLQKVSERNCASSATNVRPDRRADQRVDRDAGEQQQRQREPAARCGEPVDERGNRERACERGDGQRGRAHVRGKERGAEHDHRRRAERARSTRRRPRIGKRVAEQRLHRGAGRAEAAADQQRERDARRADVDQHRARCCAAASPVSAAQASASGMR